MNDRINNTVDWPFVHKEQYKKLAEDCAKFYSCLCAVINERDSNRIIPDFKDGFVSPKEIRLKTISEEDFKRLQRLDKLIDEVRIKIYG